MNQFPVTQQGFDRTAVGLLTPDGVDAAGVPTLTPTDWVNEGGVTGVGILLPPAAYGQRITGIDASIDQSIDYPRGLRVVALAIDGGVDAAQLAGLVGQWPGYVGTYASEIAVGSNISSGAIVPDLTDLGSNSEMGFIVDLTVRRSLPYRVLADVIRHPGNSKFGANNGTAPLQTANDGHLSLAWNPGLWVLPNSAAVVVVSSYRPYSGAVVGAIKLYGATVRGSVHGYAITTPPANATTTPGNYGNIAVPGH